MSVHVLVAALYAVVVDPTGLEIPLNGTVWYVFVAVSCVPVPSVSPWHRMHPIPYPPSATADACRRCGLADSVNFT